MKAKSYTAADLEVLRPLINTRPTYGVIIAGQTIRKMRWVCLSCFAEHPNNLIKHKRNCLVAAHWKAVNMLEKILGAHPPKRKP